MWRKGPREGGVPAHEALLLPFVLPERAWRARITHATAHFTHLHCIKCTKNEVHLMPTNIRRFFTHDRVCTLTLTVSMPDNLTDAEAAFYTPLASAFERTAEERIFPLADAAYSECADRRKRWRYTPWQAHFCLTKDCDTLVLCITSCQTVHVKEAHTWREGVIIRRKRLP